MTAVAQIQIRASSLAPRPARIRPADTAKPPKNRYATDRKAGTWTAARAHWAMLTIRVAK